MKIRLLIPLLALAAPSASVVAAGPDLPEWDGKAPEQFVLGGGLWPSQALPAANQQLEEAERASRLAAESPGGDPVATVRPDGQAGPPILSTTQRGGDVVVMNDAGGSGGLRPVVGLRVPMPVLMPLSLSETFTQELPPVAGELRDEYFSLRPVEYLVDPQRLLTEQKSHDVQRFLEYHADEAQFDICLLLFGANQDIPADISLEERYREWFRGEPVVLVAYFLEHPEKTRLVFSDSVREKLPPVVFDRIFQSCVREAQVAETPFDQVERLAIELSIRLYWMAKLLERQQAGEVIGTTHEELHEPAWEEYAAESHAVVLAAADSRATQVLKRILGLPWLWLGVSGILLAFVLGAGAWWWRRDSLAGKPVLFPDIELPARLGGVYSGGGYVGISFEVSAKKGSS